MRGRLLHAGSFAGPALALAVVLMLFPAPLPILAVGVVFGSISALVAVGIVLTYRATRVVNFAQGDLGALAPLLGVLLMVDRGWSFWPAFGAGLACSIALTTLLEVSVLRRFARSPRLVVTVVTIGLALLLQGISLFLPRLFGYALPPQDFVRPFDARLEWGPVIFRGAHVLTVLVVPVVAVAVATFLRWHRWGRATRAVADSSDRALLLGIPVPLVTTLAWVLAAGLSALAAELRTLVVGVAIGTPLGPALMLRALAAAVIARMESLPRAVAAALALGVVEQAVYWERGETASVDAVLFVAIVVALVVARRRRLLRGAGAASWVPLAPVRPTPPELRRLPEVRGGAAAAAVAVAALLVVTPAFVGVGRASLLATFLIYALVGMSLLVLTGWAGQVSLGQMAFVAIGSCVTGTLAQHGWALPFALVAGGAAGALIAVLVSTPALRLGGVFAMVATFAAALVIASVVLDAGRFPWLVPGPQLITRPVLFGKFDLGTEHAFYWFTLAVVAACGWAVWRLRGSPIGRALVAARDNEEAAQSYGVSVTRARLISFAVSGVLAGLAGGLLVYQQRTLVASSFGVEDSIAVFATAVFGGIASLLGVVLGAAWYQLLGGWSSSASVSLLASGLGLMLVLLVVPGGLAQALYGGRDVLLRWLARRRRILVPSLAGGAASRETTGRRSEAGGAPAPALRTPDPERVLLEVRDLHVARGRAEVLFGVDFEIRRGELVALLGSNGAGKSTLLNTVAGLLAPSSGRIRLAGQDVTGLSANRIAALGVGLVPGMNAVFPSLSVRENLELAGWLDRGDNGDAAAAGRAIDDVLDAFPLLRARWEEPAGNLSGGEQRMLALAQVLLARPRLLLVDELSFGLAPTVVDQLLEAVRSLHAGGTTVVLVEPSPAIAARVASRAVFLDQGQVCFDGPMEVLIDRRDLLRGVFLDGGEDRRSTPSPPSRPAVDGRSVLEAHRVSVSFGAVAAVQEVDLAVAPGHIVGVVGPNGAGKTVLFDLLSGYTRPSAGHVLLEGVDVTSWPPSRRARAGLGRSFQDARLFPSTTVAETIAIAVDGRLQRADTAAGPASEVEGRVAELIELFHLEPFANKFVAELSTGTRRIVDLACSLALEPRVLLLDEPSAGLARRETEALAPLLLDVRARTGAALVVIEHDLELVSSIADELIALELGRVVARGSPQEVVRHPRVVESYLGNSWSRAAAWR